MQRFKERLTARRNALNLSQIELAEESGVSARAIAGYESKGNPPAMRIVEKLATALTVSPTWLLGGEEPQFLSLNDAPEMPNQDTVADLLAAIEVLQQQLLIVKQRAEKLQAEKTSYQSPRRAASHHPEETENTGPEITIKAVEKALIRLLKQSEAGQK